MDKTELVVEKFHFLGELLRCSNDLGTWIFTSEGELSEEWDNPHADLAYQLFCLGEDKGVPFSLVLEHNHPTVWTNKWGLIWMLLPATFENERNTLYFAIGPCLIDSIKPEKMTSHLEALECSESFVAEAIAYLPHIPVMSLTRIIEYAVMLYFCVTGEHMNLGEVHYRESSNVNESKSSRNLTSQSLSNVKYHGTYAAEQEVLNLLRKGDLTLIEKMNELASTGSMGRLSNGDSMREMKNALITNVVLFSRAAIEGGLPAETSLTLADHYYQSIEACSTTSELVDIAKNLQTDYVSRVHMRHKSKERSQSIQAAMDYIDLHLMDDYRIEELARELGYSPAYLQKKFLKETGISLRAYQAERRIEKATRMLENTRGSIHEISDSLGFCSQSYFCDTFKRYTSMSPQAWRKKYGKV